MGFLPLSTILIFISLLVSVSMVYAEPAIRMQQDGKYNIESGELFNINTEVTNNTTDSLRFAYMVQIKDPENVTIQLYWVDGISVEPSGKTRLCKIGLPEEPGQYIVEIFAWKSIVNPEPLAPVHKVTVVVQ